MRSWIWVVLACLCSWLLLVVPAVGASDFRLEHGDEGWEFSSDAGVSGEVVESEEGERYAWSLESQESRLVGEIWVPAGLFDVERVRQVVPMVDDGLFFEVREERVEEAEGRARVVNITREDDGGFVYRIAFPFQEGSDEAVLTMMRDVEPPGFIVGEVENLSHNRFYVETQTDEPAWGTLRVWPAGAGSEDMVPFPTTNPSHLQRFPVRGLQPETEYRFHVEFRDWAQNVAVSDPVGVNTTAQDVGESPRIGQVVPAPGAVLSGPPEAIEAEIDPVEGDFAPSGIRLFVDLEEVSSLAVVSSDRIRYVPAEPLAPGDHVVRLELTNTAGGEESLRWEFHVEEGEEVAGLPGILILGGVLGALVWVRGRRGPSGPDNENRVTPRSNDGMLNV